MAKTPKFTVLHEQHRGKTFELEKDVISIGRRDGMDICIKDPSMSGHHADLIKTEREDGKSVYILRDNNSSNGTRINNIPIEEQELVSSDLILFGMVEVLYDGEDDGSANSFAPSTHTIDLSSIDSNMSTVPNVGSLNPFAEAEAKRHTLITRLLIAAGIIMALTVIAVIVMALKEVASAS